MVPESPNAASNSPALPETEYKAVEYVALIDNAQDNILEATSHDNGVNKCDNRDNRVQEDRDLVNNKKDAIGTAHVYARNLSVDGNWVESKNHLKRRITGLDENARVRLKRTY